MSRAGLRLSLGPIPKPDAVKLTITVSAELRAQLDAYAEMHSRVHQAPVDASTLVPHMLAAFMARDRGFRTMLIAAAKPKAD
ncbi:DUF2274 domain-containing protein [Xylophilus sp. ASV27]|uniref:DUF2274 domain-containing protein n=1 Tax=Xylophilus sp. ASV27 TaxID=2795129 RepID=UPI0018ED9F6B|nr:DUF2274 domain-containing protein [Xylophilus sp. ASV27]